MPGGWRAGVSKVGSGLGVGAAPFPALRASGGPARGRPRAAGVREGGRWEWRARWWWVPSARVEPASAAGCRPQVRVWSWRVGRALSRSTEGKGWGRRRDAAGGSVCPPRGYLALLLSVFDSGVLHQTAGNPGMALPVSSDNPLSTLPFFLQHWEGTVRLTAQFLDTALPRGPERARVPRNRWVNGV